MDWMLLESLITKLQYVFVSHYTLLNKFIASFQFYTAQLSLQVCMDNIFNYLFLVGLSMGEGSCVYNY